MNVSPVFARFPVVAEDARACRSLSLLTFSVERMPQLFEDDGSAERDSRRKPPREKVGAAAASVTTATRSASHGSPASARFHCKIPTTEFTSLGAVAATSADVHGLALLHACWRCAYDVRPGLTAAATS